MCSMGLGRWEGASALGNVWSHIGDKSQGDYSLEKLRLLVVGGCTGK